MPAAPLASASVSAAMAFSSLEDGEGMTGGGESERSDDVEELATVCESPGGTVGGICG
jgi:hypothetical protein